MCNVNEPCEGVEGGTREERRKERNARRMWKERSGQRKGSPPCSECWSWRCRFRFPKSWKLLRWLFRWGSRCWCIRCWGKYVDFWAARTGIAML